MYELFLLGKLMQRPWHGYEFQRVLNLFVGPMRKVSWGTIYPLLRRLEKDGLIEPVPALAGQGGHSRRQYSITAAGRKRFLELMRTDLERDAEYRDTFRVRLGNFSRASAETRRSIIDRYMVQLSTVISHSEAMSERVKAAPEVGEAERKHILLALAHDRFLAESDRNWVLRNTSTLLSDDPRATISSSRQRRG